MKFLILVLCFISFTIHAEDILKESIEIEQARTLLPLEPKYPLGLSIENQTNLWGPEALAMEQVRNKSIFDSRSFPWLAVAFIVIGTILWVLWMLYFWPVFFKKRKSIPFVSPGDEALNLLNEVENKKLIETKNFKEYFMHLTNILRYFIERQFALPAMAETSEEFLQEISSRPFFSENQKRNLKQFLEVSDKVKFANYATNENESRLAFQNLEEFIKKG